MSDQHKQLSTTLVNVSRERLAIVACLVVVAFASVAVFAFLWAGLNASIQNTHSAALASCVRVNYLRAQSNVTSAVDYLVLSGSVQQIKAAIPTVPKAKRAQYRAIVKSYEQLITTLAVTPFTHCPSAVDSALSYHLPAPIFIGSGKHVPKPEALRIYKLSQMVLNENLPVGAFLQTRR